MAASALEANIDLLNVPASITPIIANIFFIPLGDRV
jgi:hypothetical protein